MLKEGYYWFRSHFFDEEEVIEEYMSRPGLVWYSSVDKVPHVLMPGVDAMTLEKCLKTYHLLERVVPCSI
jgi:hypothetical protein